MPPLANGLFCGFIDPAIHVVLIPAVFTISFIAFLWAVFYYAIAGEYDEFAREMAKGLMLWSIMAFLVMAAVWGAIDVIYGWLGISSGMC